MDSRLSWLILIVFLAVWLNGSVQAQDLQTLRDTMQLANNAYLEGDFEVAIAGYETLVQQGIRDATLYYNLGSAYYEARQLGQALLYFKRAQQLIPRDAQLAANIALVRNERVDFFANERNWIDQLTAVTSGIMTLGELRWLTLFLWGWFFIIMTIWLLIARWRDLLLRPMIVLGILTIVVVSLYLPRVYSVTERPEAVVLSLSTQVMSGPGDDYLPIFQLFAGAELRILDVKGDWARFVLPDGRQGWVTIDQIEQI